MSRVMQAVLDSLESFERSHPAFEGEFREEREMLRIALAEPEKPCPYVQWTDEGTHWCALAAKGEQK